MEKVDFACKLETVDTKEVLVNLFKSADEQDGGNMDNLEFLMHLDAEITDQGNEKVQEAEFIIVVDRLESMKIVRFSYLLHKLLKERLNARHPVETSARSSLQDAGLDERPGKHQVRTKINVFFRALFHHCICVERFRHVFSPGSE